LPAYVIKKFEGIPVAFIGLALKNTPNIVSPSGVAGLEFRDEAETVNALVPQLRQRGIEAIVELIHEGGFPAGDYNECRGIAGPIVDIVGKLDKAVDLVVSRHTHRAYRCVIDGRLVTSADKFGTTVTEIELEIDRKTQGQQPAVATDTGPHPPLGIRRPGPVASAVRARALDPWILGVVGVGDGLPQFAVELGVVDDHLLAMDGCDRAARHGEVSRVFHVHDELWRHQADGPEGFVVVGEEYLVAFFDGCIGHGCLPFRANAHVVIAVAALSPTN
jgi:hypothetical protein